MNPTPRKNGRPRKITDADKRLAFAVLAAGGSMVDVRGTLAVDRRTIERERHRDAGLPVGH